MKKVILVALVLTSLAPAALARTQPNDLVRVIKSADDSLNWQMYDKKFRELKFDAKTLNRIKQVENQLAQDEYNGPSRYRLTNVRIVANQVQILLFRNDYGDTTLVDMSSPDATCSLSLSGNGFSRCDQYTL